MRFGVTPEKERALLERMTQLEIKEADLEESFIRSPGPGGQNVNKTSTGVFLRHRPTGIAVKSTRTRSQPLNRYYARQMLTEKVEEHLKGSSRRSEAAAKLKKQKKRRARRQKKNHKGTVAK